MAKKKDLKSKKQYDFEGMTLTPWQKISTTLFGGIFRERSRKDIELKKLLVQADIRVMPEVYKSTQLMSTIAVMIGCGALIALLGYPLLKRKKRAWFVSSIFNPILFVYVQNRWKELN